MKLKPCPKCRYENTIGIVHDMRLRGGSWFVKCWNCGKCSKKKIFKHQAIKSWNKEWEE